VPAVNSCKFSQQFSTLGTYRVKLTVRDANGQSASITKKVVVKDWLIVSLGDSYASGEGNPDVPQKFDQRTLGTTVLAGPIWVDRRCHRSGNSGPAFLGRVIEDADPHASVTFLSLACAGAEIASGVLEPYPG